MMKFFTLLIHNFTSQIRQYSSLNICIIGSGPAGFYTAQRLLKNLPEVYVDIYEKYPVPFGLVRFGVAPDHPEVKNVINTFMKTGVNPRVRFIGNVSLGKDVFLKELRNFYNIVVLAYGADNDVELGIPGEKLNNVISARKFVGWYNGLPEAKNLEVDLKKESVVILGQGNVALDVARILFKSVDELKNTDITEHALSTLSQSKVKHVYAIGRRGPLQVAFTIKEFREIINLKNVQTVLQKDDFDEINVAELPRPRKRLTELMISALTKKVEFPEKYFHVSFLRSPIEIVGDDRVEKVEFSVNRLVNVNDVQVAENTNRRDSLNCDLVLRSIGYKRVGVDPDIPVHNLDSIHKVLPGVYSVGWLSTGPVGVILSTMTNAFAVADLITKDVKEQQMNFSDIKPGYSAVEHLMKNRSVAVVNWNDWGKIDLVEIERGKLRGKPREKIVDIGEMLQIANCK